jgi:DNA-binding MarR family transcriptional regulator
MYRESMPGFSTEELTEAMDDLLERGVFELVPGSEDLPRGERRVRLTEAARAELADLRKQAA